MMTNSTAWAMVLVFASVLGALVLLAFLIRVRSAIGWTGNNTIAAILADGLIFLIVAIVIVDAVSFGRAFGYLSGDAGVLIARFTILSAVFFGVWFGVLRMLIWMYFGDRTETERIGKPIDIHHEIIRLRANLDRYLTDRTGARGNG